MLERLPTSAGSQALLLAVSGGPDSLALLLLLAEGRAALLAAGYALHVATVDHGLRAASREEAAFVARLCAALGLPHRTLLWTGPKPAGNLAGTARRARYELLADAARALGAPAILTAHHQDDQIETHFLAAARGAGDRGLAGMRAARDLAPGLSLLRPFLAVPGAALKTAVAIRGICAVDDPSNRDPRFDRARLRASLDLSAAERRACLARIAAHAARRDAEDAALAAWLGRLRGEGALWIDALGGIGLEATALREAPPSLAPLLLGRILRAAGGADYPPPRAALARLLARLGSDTANGATLGGAVLDTRGPLVVRREYGRQGLATIPVGGGGALVFDRRFEVAGPVGGRFPPASRLAAFGDLRRGNPAERVLPVLLDAEDRLVAAPEVLARKAGPGCFPLPITERLSFRIDGDLPKKAEFLQNA